MRTKNFWRIGTLAVLSLALLTACGSKSATGDKSTSGSTTKSSKSTITWTAMLHTATAPSGDVQSKLEAYTGKKIKFSWVPDASKDERINALLASNSLTDIVSLTDIKNTTVRKAMSSGMFWDVEPYLKDYPNLKSISKKTIAASKLDGHLYGIPFQKPMARYGVLVRQDWLDKLGLKTPHTIAELEKVAKAFTEDDPDGDGKKDTTGFVERNESYNVGFRSISGYFGAGNNFAVVDGKVTPAFMQPEFKTAMKWYRKLYKNGWMNSDFAVMAKTDQKNYIAQGKGGIVVSGLMDASNYVAAAAGTDQEKTMKWALINDITYDDVSRRILSDTNGGMGGWLAISKESVKTKADLKVVLKFINDLMDKKPYILMTQGIEGVHYKLNAKKEYETIDQTKWQQEVQPYAGSRPSELVTPIKYTDPLKNLQDKKISENTKYAVTDPTQALTSETYDTQWSTLVEGISDAYYKYIMGDISMSGFDDAVSKFQSSGGDKVIKEFTQSYKESKK